MKIFWMKFFMCIEDDLNARDSFFKRIYKRSKWYSRIFQLRNFRTR